MSVLPQTDCSTLSALRPSLSTNGVTAEQITGNWVTPRILLVQDEPEAIGSLVDNLLLSFLGEGNHANNLAARFTATGVTAGYGYDAQGRRVRVTHNGVTTIQVYDAMGRLAVEYSTQAPAQTNGVYYQTTDHLGSTRIVTDSGGQVKLRRDFFPFGEEIPASASYGNRHRSRTEGRRRIMRLAG